MGDVELVTDSLDKRVCDVINDDTTPGSALVLDDDGVTRIYRNGTVTTLQPSRSYRWSVKFYVSTPQNIVDNYFRIQRSIISVDIPYHISILI